MSKFADFVSEKKLDPRRIIAASTKLEKLRPEDRALILQKKQGKAPAKKEGEEDAAPPKRRSGRPVTPRLIADVTAGKKVSGAAKTRLLRAVNAVLVQKNESEVELKQLF